MPGVVPEVEEREAARFNGYNWKDWQQLPQDERVDGVAYFRIRRQIGMHEQDAQEKEISRKRRRK